jgi:hypothetical protein
LPDVRWLFGSDAKVWFTTASNMQDVARLEFA